MAKVSPVRSVRGSDDEGAPSPPKTANQESTKASEEPMEVDEEDEGEAGEENGEEEYEIEAILDAKRGSFPGGRIGYFVKWKGYDETENSWVDEKDAGNADALIKEYWKKTKKQGAKTPAKPRKSATSASVAEASEPSAKKRGRKSQPGQTSSARDEAEVTEVRATKKAKKTDTAQAKSDGATPAAEDDDEIPHFTDMAAYMAISSWEHLVSTVDTIERNHDGTLSVYFRLPGGERIKEDSKICAERFPQKLIQFYESNLRWKAASVATDDES